MSSVSEKDLVPVWMPESMIVGLILFLKGGMLSTPDKQGMINVLANAMDNPQKPTVDLTTESEA